MSTNLELLLRNPTLTELKHQLNNLLLSQQRLIVLYDGDFLINSASSFIDNKEFDSVIIACLQDYLKESNKKERDKESNLVSSLKINNPRHVASDLEIFIPRLNINQHANIKQFLGQQFYYFHADARLAIQLIENSEDTIFNTDVFNLNNFMAILGCLLKGGVLLLRVDNVRQLPISLNIFLELASINHVYNAQESSEINSSDYETSENNIFKNEDCLQDIEAIYQQIEVNKKVFLTGFRGRGKTTLLSKLITKWIAKKDNVLIIAPSKNSIKPILNEIINSNVSRETYQFCAPENVTQYAKNYKYIVTDEAASLPAKFIAEIIDSLTPNQNLILSGTIDGYEGQGQAFFQRITQPKFHIIKLEKNWRYTENDIWDLTSRQLCDSALLLSTLDKQLQINDAKLDASCERIGFEDGYYYLKVSNMINPRFVMQLYQFLTASHYRTSPKDLANMLERDNEFYFIIKDNCLAALALVINETLDSNLEFDVNLNSNWQLIVDEIMAGNRRPKGNLAIQALLTSYANKEIAKLKIKRIARISTRTDMRRQGLASKLINNIACENSIDNNVKIAGKTKKAEQIDYLAVSFSATEELINFWQYNGFYALRLGLKLDKYRASYACLMLKLVGNNVKNKAVNVDNFAPLYIDKAKVQLLKNRKMLADLNEQFITFYDFYWNKIYKNSKKYSFNITPLLDSADYSTNTLNNAKVSQTVNKELENEELENEELGNIELQALLLDLERVVFANKDLLWIIPRLRDYLMNDFESKKSIYTQLQIDRYQDILVKIDSAYLLKKDVKKALAKTIYDLLAIGL